MDREVDKERFGIYCERLFLLSFVCRQIKFWEVQHGHPLR